MTTLAIHWPYRVAGVRWTFASAQFQNLLGGTFGMGEQLAPLNEFLASPEGDSLGVIYVTDLMSAMFGGLPTALNVFVVDAPGATPDRLLNVIKGSMEQNGQMLGDVEILALDTATVNGIPGVRGAAVADLSSVRYAQYNICQGSWHDRQRQDLRTDHDHGGRESGR